MFVGEPGINVGNILGSTVGTEGTLVGSTVGIVTGALVGSEGAAVEGTYVGKATGRLVVTVLLGILAK